ncbi:hypothetical protein SAMN05192566_0278 [Methylophilus rhizosphaerae]|uniref:Uncharacterized protein n=1 Tax=Methylophilus rhizosphaerae TaxID=492660 RepID=A0A1G8ZFT2_9PROT|nr:hypothetical protein [Methylophilus rhizosphaerae]SDK13813.1 hypothetical protein SAMN05192566_0278 [Methylophilus rhizosphaerae]
MRRWVVWVALTGTLLACWWVGQDEPSAGNSAIATSPRVPLKSVPLSAASPVTAPPMPSVPVPVQAGSGEEGPAVNLFAALAMPGAAAMAPPPAAPVNPYQYAGRLLEGGRWRVFLTDGQQQYVLQAGDRFAEGWQVAALDQQKVVLQHAGERFEIRLDDGVVF